MLHTALFVLGEEYRGCSIIACVLGEFILGNNIVVDPSRIYACIAPVGGHTCITAGERSEPAD